MIRVITFLIIIFTISPLYAQGLRDSETDQIFLKQIQEKPNDTRPLYSYAIYLYNNDRYEEAIHQTGFILDKKINHFGAIQLYNIIEKLKKIEEPDKKNELINKFNEQELKYRANPDKNSIYQWTEKTLNIRSDLQSNFQVCEDIKANERQKITGFNYIKHKTIFNNLKNDFINETEDNKKKQQLYKTTEKFIRDLIKTDPLNVNFYNMYSVLLIESNNYRTLREILKVSRKNKLYNTKLRLIFEYYNNYVKNKDYDSRSKLQTELMLKLEVLEQMLFDC